MLDIERLKDNVLLKQNGYNCEQMVNIEKQYNRLKNDKNTFQVPIEHIFKSARDIIESLEGISIKNIHEGLKLGSIYCIEFDFFGYDSYTMRDILAVEAEINRNVIFIGKGYDIIGDWIVDDLGRIYFKNRLKNKIYQMSDNIYDFIEKDIYSLADVSGENIL